MAHAPSVSLAGRQLQVQHDYMLINWQGREFCLAWCSELEEAKRTVVSDLGLARGRSIETDDVGFYCRLGGRRVELLESAWRKLAPLTPIEVVMKAPVQKRSKKVANAPQALQQQSRRRSAVDINAWRGQVGHPYSGGAGVSESRSFITPSPPLSDAQSSSQRGPSPSQDSFPPVVPDLMPDTDPSPASSVQNLHVQQIPEAQNRKGKTVRRPTSASLSNSTDSLVTSSSLFEDDGIASPAFKQIGARLGVAGSPRSPMSYSTLTARAASKTLQSIPANRKRESTGSLAELDRDSPFSEQSGGSMTATERTPQKAAARQRTRSMQRAWSAYPFKEASSNSDDLDINEYQSRRASMPAAITSQTPGGVFDPWHITDLVEGLPGMKINAPAIPSFPRQSGPGSPGDKGLRRLKSTPVGLNMPNWAAANDHSPPPFPTYEYAGSNKRSEAATWPDPILPLTTARFGDPSNRPSGPTRTGYNIASHLLGDYAPISNHKRPDSPMPFVTRSLPASPGLRSTQSTLALADVDSVTPDQRHQSRPRTRSFQSYDSLGSPDAPKKLPEHRGSSKRDGLSG